MAQRRIGPHASRGLFDPVFGHRAPARICLRIALRIRIAHGAPASSCALPRRAKYRIDGPRSVTFL
jgi:hypothetical protein